MNDLDKAMTLQPNAWEASRKAIEAFAAKEAQRRTARRVMLKACKLALLEFDRIGYQIKADPKVVELITKAIELGEAAEGKEL